MEPTQAVSTPFSFSGPYRLSQEVPIPAYLEQTYWWAYLHPLGVRFFERSWVVNTILWGNYAKLRDLALDELGPSLQGRTLQVACVYGNFTPKLAQRLAPDARLDVVDVAPVQLANVCRKIEHFPNVFLHHQDSTRLTFDSGSFDQVILFFLLHEQPWEARIRTLREASRMVKPGGRLLIVDYHLPQRSNPLRYFFRPLLNLLEPFAMDLWNHPIETWLPQEIPFRDLRKETCFNGLYQKVVLTRA